MTRQGAWLSAFWLAVSASIALSLMPASALQEPWFPGADKVQHAFAYAVLFVLGWRAGYRWLPLMLGLAALGAAIEVAQGTLTTSRSAEWLDLLADVAGIAVGRLACVVLLQTRLHSASLEQVDRR